MPAPFVIDAENIGMTSFSDTIDAVELAKRLGCYIRTTLLDQTVILDGTEDPHELYRRLRESALHRAESA
jgi:hypothetical protein